MSKAGSGKEGVRFDWQEIRRRIDTAAAAAGNYDEHSAQETESILKARARALAEAPDAIEPGERMEVVEFLLAYERYAVETRYVREVYPLDHMTPLPCTPSHVLGIINIRGGVMSVVDIRKFFGLPERGITDLDKVIVLEHGDMIFGILADEIGGVRQIPAVGLDSSQPMPAGIHRDYVQGITAEGLAVLDAKALLLDERIVVQEHVIEMGKQA